MLIGRNARPRAFIKPNFKGCIVVQGPTYKDSVIKLKEICSDYQLIFSTWEGEDVANYEEGDIVLYNKKPIENRIYVTIFAPAFKKIMTW